EFLAAHEVGYRTPFQPLPYEGAEPLAGFVLGQFLVAGVEIDPLAAQGFRQQHLGVEPGRFAALFCEVLRGPVEQPADGPFLGRRRGNSQRGARFVAHGSRPYCLPSGPSGPSPRRCFLSKSMSAWMTPSRWPAIMASSLYSVRLMRWSVSRFCGKL